MHFSSQCSLYFVVTARSKFIIIVLVLEKKNALYDYIVFLLFFLSYNCPRCRFHISLVYAFRSRWKTNSHFDLRLLLYIFLLFVMTFIIFYSTRFILQNHVIVFSVLVSFLRILLFSAEI